MAGQADRRWHRAALRAGQGNNLRLRLQVALGGALGKLLAGRVQPVLGAGFAQNALRNPRVQKFVERTSGLALIGFGIRVAFERS